MGNYSTKNNTVYFDVRLVRDAKHFEANGDKPACTFLTFVHGVKGDDCDLFIDAKIVRGSKLMSALKKGDDMVSIWGELTFKTGKDGEVRGIIHDAQCVTKVKLKDRLEGASAPVDNIPEMPVEAAAAGDAPAFD